MSRTFSAEDATGPVVLREVSTWPNPKNVFFPLHQPRIISQHHASPQACGRGQHHNGARPSLSACGAWRTANAEASTGCVFQDSKIPRRYRNGKRIAHNLYIASCFRVSERKFTSLGQSSHAPTVERQTLKRHISIVHYCDENRTAWL